jgi:TamB, inner membrane protein subunit of TAM complex
LSRSSARREQTVKFLSALRAHKAVRYLALAATIAAVLLSAAIVTTLTIDLGPSLRTLAERQASERIKRPVHIGALKLRVLRGRVELDDFSIEGLAPTDRPFFSASRLSISLDWSRAVARRPEFIITSVEMTDWNMLVEKFPDRDNFIKLRNNDTPSGGPSRFTTTMKYFRAWRGHFAYEDHEAPWSVDAPNIEIGISNRPTYNGTARFHGGLIRIQDYAPMGAAFDAHFVIDGSRLALDRIDIETDGARTSGSGIVDLAHWPEQTYQVRSRVQFPRMREIFFAKEAWVLAGAGDFTGTFHLFKGGHDLAGNFTSPMAGLYDYRFPELYGSLHWTRKAFEVANAGSRFLGGQAKFDFSISPLGEKTKPNGRFDASYANVDMAQVSDFYRLTGIRLAGRGSGSNLLEWPMGRFGEHRGGGQLVVTPPGGVDMMPPTLDEARAADPDHSRHEWGPFAPLPLPDHVPIAGELNYRFGTDTVDIAPSRFVTEKTHVSFAGTTSWGDASSFQFHVTSRDWQESDLVLAGILTDFGSHTGPVAFGGRGEFDGAMSGPFRRPRVEGTFTGDDMRAWDTVWGDGAAHIVVENSYVTIADGIIRKGDGEIRAEGKFSLGYPRDDGGEEIDARFRVSRRELESLRHAFQLDDWPVSGRLTGEFHLTGAYERPVGFGAMTIDDGDAYGEPFQRGAASLRFEGNGVRLDGVTIAKTGGTITGAAFVGWDGTYSFNADGRRLPVERTALFAYPRAQPSGIIEFSASGSSTFADPRYTVRYRINDVFVAQEPVGLITGTLALRGHDLSGELDIASPRLAVTGNGRISFGATSDADLTFRFHDSSLDPYVRLFVPRLSAYTTAVASGSIHVTGNFADVDHLVVDGTVDRVDMRLLDYAIRNAQPIRMSLDHNLVRINELQLVGDETRLTVGGTISLGDEKISVRAAGDANLGILQGFFRDVRGSGRAELSAAVDGPLYEPVFSGSATITNGRIRHFSLPNSLDAINGTIHFDSRGIQLDDVAASLGGGRVQFGGRIGLAGYLPGDLNVSVRGEDMHLRYPAGVRSTVDADLTVRGNFKTPSLGGRVLVKNAIWSRRIDPTGGLLEFGGGNRNAPETAPSPVAQTLPLRFDVEVVVPSTLRVENNLARLVASADLQLRGTYDRPLLFGRAEVARGEVTFEGRRYVVTRGNIDFTNPTRIEPFFDIEAETRVRAPGQTYQVTVRAVGTMERLQPELSSDPPLPAADVLALLFGDVRPGQGSNDFSNAEVRALQNPGGRQADVLTTRATQILANPVSAEVGKVVEQTFGVDTFQLTPTLVDPYSLSTSLRVNPSARVTIGKRISDRVYLTFSRNLSSAISDQIILLEYDESERLSWILSRNEDSTYAIEVRVRHTF